MIYGIYPLSDATIYEASESTTPGLSNPSIINTGLDAVLDISKTFDGAENPYNSRALLKFDLAAISQSISAGQVTNPKFYLSLYTTEAEEIFKNFTIVINLNIVSKFMKKKTKCITTKNICYEKN